MARTAEIKFCLLSHNKHRRGFQNGHFRWYLKLQGFVGAVLGCVGDYELTLHLYLSNKFEQEELVLFHQTQY